MGDWSYSSLHCLVVCFMVWLLQFSTKINVLDIFILYDEDTVLSQNIKIQVPIKASQYPRKVES